MATTREVENKEREKSRDVLVTGAKWRFVGNLFQKVLSFVCNQLILRNSNPQIYGLVAIQLELFLSTLLFLSREGVRLATLRISCQQDKEKSQLVINLSWLPTIIVALFILYLLICHFTVSTNNIGTNAVKQDYNIVVLLLYSFGALFESIGEPWFNMFQSYQGNMKPKVSAEALAVLTRSVFTCACVLASQSSMTTTATTMTTTSFVPFFLQGAYGFGVAQLAYGAVYLITLISHTSTLSDSSYQWTLRDFLPKPLSTTSSSSTTTTARKESETRWLLSSWLTTESLWMTVTLTGSSLLKHVLTEADKIVLTLFYTSHQQGIFAFANNYGSLVARLLFMPLEESSRLRFSKDMNDLLNTLQQHLPPLQTSTATATETPKKATTTSSSSSSSSQSLVELEEKYCVLMSRLQSIMKLVQLVTLFGLVCVVFGPCYLRVLSKFIIPKQWQQQQILDTLIAYCFYIVILGFNGVTEGFVQSVCSTKEFDFVNASFLASTAVYALSAWSFQETNNNNNNNNNNNVSMVIGFAFTGASGLVAASCLSMFVRILFNAFYIHQFFTHPWTKLSQRFHFNETTAEGTRSKQQHRQQCLDELQAIVTKRDVHCRFASPWQQTIVHQSIWLVSLLSLVVCYLSSSQYAASTQGWRDIAWHLFVGVGCFGLLALTIFRVHRNDILELLGEPTAATAAAAASELKSKTQ